MVFCRSRQQWLAALVLCATLVACDGATTPITQDDGYTQSEAVALTGVITGGSANRAVTAPVDPTDLIVNGSFETNSGGTNFAGWSEFNAGSGDFVVQTGPSSVGSAPPDGNSAAMSTQGGPGLHILWQDVTLPAQGATLSFSVATRTGSFTTPASLSYTAVSNQQFRVDIVNPALSVSTLNPTDFLVYRTNVGSPGNSAYQRKTVNLAAFGGQTVRIRFAEVDNQGNFYQGIDWVTLIPNAPLDNTPPTVTPTVTGTLGTNGWYTSDVNVSWATYDGETPITTPACAPSSVTTNTAGTTFSCTATSVGGTTTESVTIKRDDAAPAVTNDVAGTVGDNGWYTSNVGVSFTVTPGISGETSEAGCAGATLSSDTPSQSYSCTATSGAGLSGSSSVTVKRDATAPTVSFAGNAGSYTVDQNILITCSASDATSGVASNTCTTTSGAAYTFALGTTTVSAGAVDNAGNGGSNSTSFTVSVTNASLCALVNRWVSNAGVANSLCVKITHGSTQAFKNELDAQAGKKITAANAAILKALIDAL